jgi:hypothetical protein
MSKKYYAGIGGFDRGDWQAENLAGSWFIVLSPNKPYILEDVEDHFYSKEISDVTGIDFIALALKHGGFVDIEDVGFRKKSDAIKCMNELLAILNV